MPYLNKLQIIGHLASDPELHHTQNGKAVANFRVGTSMPSAAGGQEGEGYGKSAIPTEWHRVTCWEKQAQNAHKLLKKGCLVYVEGRLQTREYTNKEGKKAFATDVVAFNFQLLSSPHDKNKENSSSGPSLTPASHVSTPEEDFSYDSIPF